MQERESRKLTDKDIVKLKNILTKIFSSNFKEKKNNYRIEALTKMISNIKGYLPELVTLINCQLDFSVNGNNVEGIIINFLKDLLDKEN